MDRQSRAFFQSIERAVIQAPRVELVQDRGGRKMIPRNGGVYVVWYADSERPVYVGESSSLWQRLGDVNRSVNHTFRRKIARTLHLETLAEEDLSVQLNRLFRVSFLEIHIGRAEVEEYLVLRWRKFVLNGVNRRNAKGTWYDDVDAIEDWPPRF
mgnify:CR=1